MLNRLRFSPPNVIYNGLGIFRPREFARSPQTAKALCIRNNSERRFRMVEGP